MRLKFITLARLSRCCSHCQLFCSSVSLRNVSIFVWLLQGKDGAVVVVLENTGSCCFSMALGALGTLLWAGSQEKEEEAPFLHGTWSSSTESKKLLVLRLLLPGIVAMGPSPLSSMKCAGRGVGRSFQMCFFTTKACVLILWRYSVWLFPWSHGYCFFDFH